MQKLHKPLHKNYDGTTILKQVKTGQNAILEAKQGPYGRVTPGQSCWQTGGNMKTTWTRNRTLLFLTLLAGCLALVYPLAAADPAPTATTQAPAAQAAVGVGSLSLFQSLIPFLVPGLIALGKVFFPKIPKPALPVLAPILGAGIEIIGHYSGLSASTGLTGAILGASGVAVREAYDQIRKLQLGAT